MGAGDDGEASAYHTIVTERLHLRARRAADELALKALSANPAIAPNLCATIASDEGKRLTVAEHGTGRLVGGAEHGLTGLGTGIEIAVWIGEPDWGRGLATEATQGLIDHVFADNGADMLWCSNRVTNTRARRVIEKCGFQFRGTGMVRSPTFFGAFPVERFILDRRNWSSLKAWGAPAAHDEPRHETAA